MYSKEKCFLLIESKKNEELEKEILKKDFLTFEPIKDKKYVCIGNPPFGRVSSLAVLFFNKAASFSEAIGFILPRTFKRNSIINRLNENFHLTFEEDVPQKSFYPDMIENNIPKTGLRSWHFIKSKINKDILIKDLKDLDFSFSENTVRQNSLGKKELINTYELYKRGKK
jgi:hypothetical protein